jgi:Anti-sigma-K factor rskA/Sigma-70, region 4
MATFDRLSAEQRAILELVLRQGRTYTELADRLGMPEGRVRELAREALLDLAPLSARRVEEDWRGQLADYVLGQQTGPESTATRGHLRRSEAARTWARSLLDSLDGLYQNGDIPPIPDAERGAARERRAHRPPAAGGPLRTVLPEVRRRRLLVAGGSGALVVLLVVLVWPVGVLTGGGGDEGGSSQAARQTSASGSVSTKTTGRVLITEAGGKQQLLVSAQNLPPSDRRTAYGVWLYNSRSDARSIGFTGTDRKGTLQGGAALPADFRKYRFIDVSREPINNDRKHSGQSVLRGLLELLKKPVTQGSGKYRVTLLATIRLRPLASGG